MKKLLALILSIGLWTTSAEAAVVWFTGLETGTMGVGDLVNVSNCAISTAQVRSGAYSTSCTGSGLADSPNNFGLNTAYLRFYVRYSSGPSGPNLLVQAHSSGGSAQLSLGVNSSQFLEARYNNGSPFATGTWALVVNTWYLIEIKLVNAAGTGGMEAKIDNVVQFSNFSQTTNGSGAIGFLRFSAPAGNLFLDDIMLSDSGYPGAGRNIARQGIAGAPTYDAWTKNSCSGGTIDNCWSDTPFSTGSNASSLVIADAQTMLVHSFATTQTGHGTDVIGSGDTINACKVVINAKAAAGSQIKIRRRLGGADTDTIRNLSATDTQYDDGVWTDTFTNLNAAEIGVVQNSGP